MVPVDCRAVDEQRGEVERERYRYVGDDAVDVEPPVAVDRVLGQQPADEHEQRHVEQVYQVVRCGDRGEVGKVLSDGQQEMPDCDKND